MTEIPTFKQWAILELMGHRKLAGLVTEEVIAGAGLIRIDIPNGDESSTQYYSPTALYCLTPCSEDLARKVAASYQPAPVSQWDLKTLPSPIRNPVNLPYQDDDMHEDDE